jgi:hypothetical protein
MTREKAQALEEIRRKRGGLLLPSDVVKAAAKPGHPLHNDFEWDDTRAAKAHRLQQAKLIIRAAVTILPAANHGPTETRVYVSLPSDRVTGGGYRHVVDVLNDEERSREMAESLAADLKRLIVKYSVFSHLKPTLANLEDLISEVSLL